MLIAAFCSAAAAADGWPLRATEAGPLGHRQVILAWLDWIGPDRFPGDRGPRLPDEAKIYSEMTEFVERSER